MTSRSVGPCERSCFISSIAFSAASEAVPRCSSRSSPWRHQLEVLQRTRPARVRLTRLDRIIWLLLYRLWPRCLDAVVIVKPETVIAWHHKGFGALWAWKSRPRRRGRPPVPGEVRTLIRRITRENPLAARSARPRRTSHAWDRDQSGRCDVTVQIN